jgi:hypothetical protein
MNVEIGAEAAQFPEKEYINGIFVAVRVHEKLELQLQGLPTAAAILNGKPSFKRLRKSSFYQFRSQ